MKKALFLSLFMFLFSIMMFAGTTYAWFTEDVAINNNTIVMGDLDMEVSYTDNEVVKDYPNHQGWVEFDGQNSLYDLEALEPGDNDIRWVQVRNVGNIPLKFRFVIDNVNEAPELANSITFITWYGVNEESLTGIENIKSSFITLQPGEHVIIPIRMHVDECLENPGELQSLSFDITVEARQRAWNECEEYQCEIEDENDNGNGHECDENCGDDCEDDCDDSCYPE